MPKLEKQIYNLTPDEVLQKFNTSLSGLSNEEVGKRLEKYGFNRLPEAKAEGLAAIFWRQFRSPLIYVLLLAALAVFFTSEISDGFVILFIIFFNAVIGTIQEGRAQNTLLALKKMTQTDASVIRGGRETIVDSDQLVPGDVIVLREGDKVPADARLIHDDIFKVDEAVITGESSYKIKTAEPIMKEVVPVADQENMVFSGMYVVAGTSKAVVVVTGIETFIGKISQKAALIDSDMPLKKDIQHLSKIIIISVSIIVILLMILGLLAENPILDIFKVAVAVAVSVVPEGLPIVMTVVLAMGVWRMSKHNVLVKRLQAVEALGQAEIIAVDKTGTLTKNELSVEKVYCHGKIFNIAGAGYDPTGEIRHEKDIIDPLNYQELLMAGRIASFCSNAQVAYLADEKIWKVSGDPVEAAMLVFSEKVGFKKEILESEMPKLDELPFDYKTKIHATLNRGERENFLAVSGAPEKIIEKCVKIWHPNGGIKISQKDRDELEKIFVAMSKEGLRVIAIARAKTLLKTVSAGDLAELSFMGFLAMKDVLREEAKEAVAKAQAGGIKVVMLTGDHKISAEAIAKEAGICKGGEKIITGDQIDGLSDFQLEQAIGDACVFARVTPEHKLRIIEAYRRRGEVVAMTGDGVNDALSLAAADLGVSMGKIGTEVAKESSDIVLLDDNFGNIVLGIKEGKNILKTIKKVILYLFSTSAGELLVIFATFIIGWPLPILAVQILWLNLVTDGFLDISLAMEPREKGMLAKIKNKYSKRLVDWRMARRIVLMAAAMMVGTLFLFGKYFEDDLEKAWTVSLTVLAVFQWFNAWNCRSEEKSIFTTNPFSNLYLVSATVIVIILQCLALYTAFGQKILHTVPLGAGEWALIISVGFSIVVVEEARKALYRFMHKFD
ncbi:MAG: HAD-IC family P-type ATPase [Parcubacteria group bacterium]